MPEGRDTRDESRDVAQKRRVVAAGENGVDEPLEGRLVALVGLRPTRARLRFAHRFEHVLLEPGLRVLEPSAIGEVIDPAAGPGRRPDADERLINEIFGVRVRRQAPFDRLSVAVIQPPPTGDGAAPLRRAFAERVETRADVGAALRVMSVRADKGRRPRAGALGVRAVQTAHRVVERPFGRAADLVPRHQGHVDVERRVLHALGRRRTACLLQALDERQTRASRILPEHAVANRFDFAHGLAARPVARPLDGALDDRDIVRMRSAGAAVDVSAVYGKRGNVLDDGSLHFIVIPSAARDLLLRPPSKSRSLAALGMTGCGTEEPGDASDISVQCALENLHLPAVGDVGEGSTRQAARRAVGALDRGATFRIEKDILEVVEEFVARRALHWPRRAELLTRRQDLFHDDRKWLASLRARRALLHLGAQPLEIA